MPSRWTVLSTCGKDQCLSASSHLGYWLDLQLSECRVDLQLSGCLVDLQLSGAGQTFSYLRWTFSYLCQEIRWPVGTGGQTCFTYKNGQTGPSVRWLQTCKLHLHLPSHTGCCHLSSGTGTFLRSHTLRESRDVRAGRVAESSAWLPQAWLCTFWMARDGAQGGRQPGGVGGCAQDPWVQFALFPSPDSQKWMAPRLSPL